MEPAQQTQQGRPDAPSPRAWPRPARWALAALLALAGAWIAAHAVANRESTLDRLRARAEATLARRLPGASLGPEVSVDWLFRATVGPLTVPAAAKGAPPVVRVERIKVRAAVPALLAGRVEPASVKLYDAVVSPGPGGRELKALAERLQAPRTATPAAAEAVGGGGDPVLVVRRLSVALPGDRTVGPIDLRLARERRGEREVIEGTVVLQGGGTVEAVLERAVAKATSSSTSTPTSTPIPIPTPGPRPSPSPSPSSFPSPRPSPTAGERENTPPAWTLTLSARATPADLPALLRDRAVRATHGDLSFQAEAAATPAGATASLRGALSALTLAGEPLGPEAVGPLSVTGEVELAWSRRDQSLTVGKAVLRPAGPLEVRLTGRASAAGERPFELTVEVPPVGYRALVEALPAALVPGPEAPRPDGALSARLTLAGPLDRPALWTVTGDLDLAGLREAAKRAPPSPLRAPFTARPGEDAPEILVGPANPDFVPIAELPEHVVRCVTTAEDAGFFAHRGFDFGELKNAAAAAVSAGQLRRGGSTISQQLAKNLYLSRDRTLARKAREALLTVALEGTVPKARLLEIYLNVIEWGPGLYGLGPASRHYFGVDARALSPRQGCFLAAIIPSPRKSGAAVAAGRPASLWADHVDDLLLKLQLTGVLSEEQLTEALAEPLAFHGVPASPDAAAAPPPGGAAGADAEGEPDR